MVSVSQLPKPGEKLDLAELHKSIHNLVLSRRKDVGFWEGTLETAWAGLTFASHLEVNQDTFVINLIKGEILGDKRPTNPNAESELAACYMIAAFFQEINLSSNAVEFIELANKSALEIATHVDPEERFHLFSTPEYLYAIVLAHQATNRLLPDKINEVVLASLDRIREADWYRNAYIFALAGTAYLMINDYSQTACELVMVWPLTLDLTKIDEASLPITWFFERNWDLVRLNINETHRKTIDETAVVLRSKLLHSLDQFDVQLAWSLPMDADQDEAGSDGLIISTIELLMLDEIAEKHSQQSLILTQEEIDGHRLLSSAFQHYKLLVDEKLAQVGLGGELDAIYEGLATDNPASWQNAILGCRNVLYGLSKILWQVPGDEYKLPNGEKISVKQDREKNRLLAYLAYKGVSKTQQPIIKAEFEAMINLTLTLIDKSAKAKHKISKEEAFSLVMALYVTLGELIALTDLEPAT
ncbi:MAG: hypothetical protein KDI79_08520 [Anaerolineae bacterium]|nr:hypothetical protein [Anaerolineae bacterium]